MVREALSADDVVVLGAEDSADKFDREVEALADFPFTAAFAGEGVLPTTGGVAVREGGGVGLCTMGLSQDSKKSADLRFSSCAVPISSATTEFGYNFSSLAARRLSSVLYAMAPGEVYLTLGSLEWKAAALP